MSDEPVGRDAIADAITADLQAMDKAEAPPPESAAPAAAPEVAPQAETAAPAPDSQKPAPEAKTLADTDLVIDPADGQAKAWGEIKAERLRQADYTKKTMALAEERRRIVEYEANLKSQQALAEARAKAQALPELPEDDPYAQHQRALREQLEAVAEYQRTMAAQMQEEVRTRELEASRMALDAKEAQLVKDHGLTKRELELVEREYLARGGAGEQVTIDQIAKEHAVWRESIRQAGIEEFKAKHRVEAPAAQVAVPAAGTATETPVPGSRSFAEAIREEIGALMR